LYITVSIIIPFLGIGKGINWKMEKQNEHLHNLYSSFNTNTNLNKRKQYGKICSMHGEV
jgi:hypothetical protein